MSRRRIWIWTVIAATLALLASATAASAAVRFAVPTGGSITSNCTAGQDPCTLQRAAEAPADGGVAANGDEVIVNPGVYSETDVLEISNAISVHGVAGQARPQIESESPIAVLSTGSGASFRYLGISGSGAALWFDGGPANADQIVAQVDPGGPACRVSNVAASITITNSVCQAADHYAVEFGTVANVGAQTLFLRNVTAVSQSTHPLGGAVFVLAQGGADLTLDAENVIADGVTDVIAQLTGMGSTSVANLAFSNYDTEDGNVTPPGTGDNQVAPPIFADADLHQAPGSPTINSGGPNAVGSLDPDGDPRTFDSATDIGADEFVPSPGGGPTVPVAPDNAFTIRGVKGRTLTLNLASAGGVEVTDAGAAPGAGATAAARRRLKPSSASGGPGDVEVRMKLTKAAAKKLRRAGKLKVNARVTFTPSGGTASSQTNKLRLRRKG